MCRHLPHFTKYCAGLLFVLLSLLSCAPPQNQAPVINGLLYPAEVPASFDTMLICRVADTGKDEIRFRWSSENGTLRGEGESNTWTAPAVLGTYKVDLKAINTSGLEAISQASIVVLPFYLTQIDPDPEINLRLPLIGSGAVSALSLVRPMTTSEINCESPFAGLKAYKYVWSCNGGKILGTGMVDGTASKIGWVSPGVPGYYTVTAKITDNLGNLYTGSVYFNVVNPSCCGQ